MAGPWEKYAATPGPWSRYGAAPEEPVVDRAALGGSGAVLSAGQPTNADEDFWGKAARLLKAAVMGRPGEIAADEGVKEAVFGHPDREEAAAAGLYQTPTTAQMAEAGMAGMAALEGGGLIARGVGGGLSGGGAAYAAVRKAGPRGIARGLAEIIENPRGLITKPLRAFAEGGAKAAPEAAAEGGASGTVVPFQAPSKPPVIMGTGTAPKPLPSEVELMDKILRMRKEHGMSGAQMTETLRELYGIPPKDGQKMVDMVLSQFLKARPR